MGMITDQSAVLNRLDDKTKATSVEPTLTSGTLQDILSECALVTVWTATTAYEYGDRVVPTTANRSGRVYRARISFTSGATEPTWPCVAPGVHVDDNSTSGAWIDDGVAPVALWDIKRAERLIWERKAEYIAHQIDISDGDLKLQLTQRRAGFLRMANRCLTSSGVA